MWTVIRIDPDFAAYPGWNTTLTTLTQALFDTSVPPEVLVQLRAQRPATENVTIALKLRDQDPRGHNTLNQLRYMPRWQRVRFIWYTIVPPRGFVCYLYSLGPDVSPLWPYYVRRWRDLLGVARRMVLKRLRRQ